MKRTPAAAILLAAFAAGCGGGGDDEALSKPEYVKQANAICADFNKQIEADAEKTFAGLQSEEDLTPDKARTFMESALPKFKSAVEELKALEPPSDDQEAVDKIYAAGDKEADKIEGSLDGDDEVVQLVLGGQVTPEFQKQAKAYGLDTCATD